MITPMDIHNKTFSGQIRGYSKDEVNAFLEELASDYEKIYREHRAMEEEMDIIRTKLRNYEKMESTMSHTLVMAQETADNVKKNAHKEAELSIQEAQSEAQKIVSDAEAARRKMNADLLKAEGDMNLYIEKLLSNFKSALALIEAAKAARAPQAVQAQQPAVSEPAAEAEPSSPEEEAAPAAEVPAAEVQEAAPAPAGGNLFDEAAKTVAPKEEN
ncbi:MAG: DivIVA domain-containing protein [Dialister sp.]|nr:DivIVA domain-containing protein [Dialister sp.]